MGVSLSWGGEERGGEISYPMKKAFYIDKITDCIEEVATKTSHDTEILSVSKEDLKDVTKKKGWSFPWKNFSKLPERSLYKLIITGDPAQIIQGLISLEIMRPEQYKCQAKSDGHFPGSCPKISKFVL